MADAKPAEKAEEPLYRPHYWLAKTRPDPYKLKAKLKYKALQNSVKVAKKVLAVKEEETREQFRQDNWLNVLGIMICRKVANVVRYIQYRKEIAQYRKQRKEEKKIEKAERKKITDRVEAVHREQRDRVLRIVQEERQKQAEIQAAARKEFLAALGSEVDHFVRSPAELAYRRYDLSGFNLAGHKLEKWIKNNVSPIVKEA